MRLSGKMLLAVLCATICCAQLNSVTAQDDNPLATGLMQFPDVSEDHNVFSYSGDLWLALTSGNCVSFSWDFAVFRNEFVGARYLLQESGELQSRRRRQELCQI